jgi:2-polyprenyl-3-methyl-5-hydroxy-6-metoxy-1,4-benzoquinol methylase
LTSSQAYEPYNNKTSQYFSGVREDILRQLAPQGGLSILEIGCGDGSTGAAALQRGIAREYHGVELFPSAAMIARGVLTSVVEGDVERAELPRQGEPFDVVIASEVLEHLVDPWRVVGRLASVLKPGGLMFASSPNVCHYRVIRMLLRGRFDLEDQGVFDRTHLRWFTPMTYRAMFETAGLTVERVGPLAEPGPRARLLMRTLPRRWHVHLWRQINLRARKPGVGS